MRLHVMETVFCFLANLDSKYFSRKGLDKISFKQCSKSGDSQ